MVDSLGDVGAALLSSSMEGLASLYAELKIQFRYEPEPPALATDRGRGDVQWAACADELDGEQATGVVPGEPARHGTSPPWARGSGQRCGRPRSVSRACCTTGSE